MSFTDFGLSWPGIEPTTSFSKQMLEPLTHRDGLYKSKNVTINTDQILEVFGKIQ